MFADFKSQCVTFLEHMVSGLNLSLLFSLRHQNDVNANRFETIIVL